MGDEKKLYLVRVFYDLRFMSSDVSIQTKIFDIKDDAVNYANTYHDKFYHKDIEKCKFKECSNRFTECSPDDDYMTVTLKEISKLKNPRQYIDSYKVIKNET